jgi:ATP:ADP antiporter, AAA family
MRDSLFSLRSSEEGGKYNVSVFLVQALFLGLFIGALDIAGHSLFLAVFDEKILAESYILSGLAGIVMFSIYYILKSGLKPRTFIVLSLALIAAIVTILWLWTWLSSSTAARFVLLVMLGPLNLIAVQTFRASINLQFRQQVKNVAPVAGNFLIIGVILISFAIPLLVSAGFSLSWFLLISALSVFAAVGLLFTNKLKEPDWKVEGFVEKIPSIKIISSERLPVYIATFIVLSVISTFFILYSFFAVTRLQFQSGENIAKFLGLFTGSSMLLILIGKHLLFSGFMERFGLRVCLAVSPVLSGILTLIIVISAAVFGFRLGILPGFMIFFVLIVLLRFLSKSMSAAFDEPSRRILYQAFGDKIGPAVHAVMEGVVVEAGVFVAGLLLTGFGLLGAVSLVHFSWLLNIFLLLWFLSALKLWSEYRKYIKVRLERIKSSEDVTEQAPKLLEYGNRFYGERIFRIDYFNLVSGDFSMFERVENRYYFRKIVEYADLKNDIILLPAIRRITAEVHGEELKNSAVAFIQKTEHLNERISASDEKLLKARSILIDSRLPQTTEILRLLRDKSVESKRLAIFMIGKFKLSDMLPEVCECMNIQGLEIDTVSVISSFGSVAEEELIKFYLVSSANISTSRTILRLLARIPLSDGLGFLFTRLWSNSRQLKELALRCLTIRKFKPGPEERERLNSLILDVTEIMVWDLQAKVCSQKNNNESLTREIIKEFDRWQNFLLDLLSITYNFAAVSEIEKNLQNGAVENVYYAQSLIDLIADEPVKELIINVLDMNPDDKKLKKLGRFYPLELPDYDRLQEEILNRDYNLLSIWTKACVLRYMERIVNPEMKESVVALLFSPESILQEEAVRLLARSDINLYRSVYNRIPVLVRKSLDRILEGETDTRDILFEKVRFLSSFLEGIYEEELIFLARKLTFHKDLKDAVISLPDGYILWDLTVNNGDNNAELVYSSKVEALLEKISILDQTSAYILPLRAIDEFLFQQPERKPLVLNWMERVENK